MKVLHLANVGGETIGGGVHEVSYNLFQNQKLLGVEPSLWFPGTRLEKECYRSDPQIKVLDTYFSRNYGIITELIKRNEVFNFDIIHQHGIWMPISILTNRYRKDSHVPTIIQPHGYLEPYSLTKSKYKKHIVSLLYEKRNLLDSSVLIACSEKEAKHLKLIYPNKDIAIIANGIPEEFIFSPISNDFIDPCPNKLKMVFLSRIHPLKGLERLFKAIHKIGVSRFKDWNIIIAGFPELNHDIFLKRLVKNLNMSELIRFEGPKFGQDKIDLISMCDVFVLPTFTENFGIVVAEALGRGIPVLTTQGAPWDELVKKNCGWWVTNNEDGIIEGLIQILETDKATFSAMGAKGRELVLSKYTWKKTTKNTIELYSYLIDKTNKPSFII
jgi:glycosyltransferase involved in cell wall biosynthesis